MRRSKLFAPLLFLMRSRVGLDWLWFCCLNFFSFHLVESSDGLTSTEVFCVGIVSSLFFAMLLPRSSSFPNEVTKSSQFNPVGDERNDSIALRWSSSNDCCDWDVCCDSEGKDNVTLLWSSSSSKPSMFLYTVMVSIKFIRSRRLLLKWGLPLSHASRSCRIDLTRSCQFTAVGEEMKTSIAVRWFSCKDVGDDVDELASSTGWFVFVSSFCSCWWCCCSFFFSLLGHWDDEVEEDLPSTCWRCCWSCIILSFCCAIRSNCNVYLARWSRDSNDSSQSSFSSVKLRKVEKISAMSMVKMMSLI